MELLYYEIETSRCCLFSSTVQAVLDGRRFPVRTDHAALTWLQRVSELMGQQGRWQERLQEYTFDIEHRPGNKHGNADALSRRLCGWSRCYIPKRNSVPAMNGRVERFADADADARRQELVEDLRWLFLSKTPKTVVKDTSSRAGQDDETAKASADVHCVLRRESANHIGLQGVVESSTDVYCVLGR